MNFYIIILLICGLSISSLAWDTEELEIFDLVEAINTNFYNFMSLSQVCDLLYYEEHIELQN